MENWGLCTYDPIMLLCDANDFSRESRQLATQVVSHELAHQWFGDTVTCPYWSDLYLNEGWARLYEYIVTNYMYPEWNVFWTPVNTALGDTSYVNFAYNPSMEADFTGTQPAVVVPQDKTGASEMYYAKGASVNYMFKNYLGDDGWNKGLAYQLTTHQWTNPNVYDLMDSFAAVGYQVKDKFLSWILQPSFPLVTLHLNDTTNILTATQKPIASSIPANQLWWITLDVKAVSTSDSTKIFETSFDFTTNTSSVQLPTDIEWNVFGNGNYSSFFVTNYDQTRQWGAVLDQLSNADFAGSIYRQQLELVVFYTSNRV